MGVMVFKRKIPLNAEVGCARALASGAGLSIVLFVSQYRNSRKKNGVLQGWVANEKIRDSDKAAAPAQEEEGALFSWTRGKKVQIEKKW